MATIPFTDVLLRTLKSDTQKDYWDAQLPAFGIRISKNSKTFVMKLKNRRVSIGRYPQMSLAEARKKAVGMKFDPAPAVPKGIRFDEALELFFTTHCQVKNRPRTIYMREQILKKRFLPVFAKRDIATITDREIAAVIDPLLNRPSSANHTFKEARTFFRWASRPPRRFIQVSPIMGMEMPAKHGRRERVLTDTELVSVWRAAERVGYPFGTIVQLLILQGQRRTETTSLQWDWIDEQKRTWTFPGTITKNGIVHCVPYGDLVPEVLEKIPRRNNTRLLFPASGHIDRAFNGWSKSKERFERLPPIRPWTLHDLRRTVSTRWAEMDVPQPVNDRLLNHITGGALSPLAHIYNRASYMPQMTEAVRRWHVRMRQLISE